MTLDTSHLRGLIEPFAGKTFDPSEIYGLARPTQIDGHAFPVRRRQAEAVTEAATELLAAAANALPTLLDQVDTLNRQIDRLAVDHEHDQRTIHDLEQQLRVAREDLASQEQRADADHAAQNATPNTAWTTPRTGSTTDARKRLAEKQGGAA